MRKKEVILGETLMGNEIVAFSGPVEAAEKLGVSRQAIAKALGCESKSSCGMTWSYADAVYLVKEKDEQRLKVCWMDERTKQYVECEMNEEDEFVVDISDKIYGTKNGKN